MCRRCKPCYDDCRSYQTFKEVQIIKRLVVAVDCDGVLRDFDGSLTAHYLKEYPDHEVKPITKWGLHEFFPIGKDIYDFAFKTHVVPIFSEALPFPGAHEFLQELKRREQVHTVIATTQRRGTEWITAQWLSEHGMHYDSLLFSPQKDILNCRIIIDDGVHNLERFDSNSAVQTLCFARPWNVDRAHNRVDGYRDVLRFIDHHLEVM